MDCQFIFHLKWYNLVYLTYIGVAIPFKSLVGFTICKEFNKNGLPSACTVFYFISDSFTFLINLQFTFTKTHHDKPLKSILLNIKSDPLSDVIDPN